MVAKSKSMGKNSGHPMKSELTIQDLASWFLSKESMTHKKLQKLCYYGVAWGYALMDNRIVKNDDFQAWVHGPVSPGLYATYKNNGWNLLPKFNGKLNVPNDITELLESVWLTYGDKDGNELEALSHIEQPWRNARKGMAETDKSTAPISSSDMKKFYLSIYQGDDK